MLFVVQTCLGKGWNTIFQKSYSGRLFSRKSFSQKSLLQASFLFVMFGSFAMGGLYGTMNNVAYAQGTALQTNVQAPIRTISANPILPIAPVAPVPQNVQNPINMTMSTTISTGQIPINSQSQSLNIPIQAQAEAQGYAQAQAQNSLIVFQNVIPQNQAPRSTYGETPYAPSLERNMYLDSVWTALVPRRQLYDDPARKMQKYRVGFVAAPKKKIPTPTKVSKSTQGNTMQKDKIKLDSGSQVLIQPGSHVTVWADTPKK